MAIPDKRFTFDLKREVTPFAHIREDYLKGPEWSDREHYEDWVRRVREVAGGDEAIREYVEKSVAEQTNIHFHVWTQAEIVEMFLGMRREFGFPLEMEAVIGSGDEVVVVLRKRGGAEEEAEALGEPDVEGRA